MDCALLRTRWMFYGNPSHSALHWCDHIYVFDNGSDDGSWELVKELAEQHRQIVPYKQDDVLYTNGLRADIFNAFRSNAGPRDWWCALDENESNIDDPRIFLAKIPNRFQTVWSASLNYYFTDQDIILYRQDPTKFLETPVQQRLRYYCSNWGELRFFRHSHDIVWTRTQGGFPPAMFTAPANPVRIWVKHFQYRSPEQIERRLRTRRPAMEASTGFWHEVKPNWSTTVATKRDAPSSISKIPARSSRDRVGKNASSRRRLWILMPAIVDTWSTRA